MIEVEDNRKKITFPLIANYDYVVKYFVEQGLEQKFIMPPPMTRKTMELGEKYSPDMVCTPFKTTIGSMIEALEAGADTIAMTFGLCRLGYYGELQEQILHDLGYQFDFVNLADYTTGKQKDYLKALKRLNPKLNPTRVAKAGVTALKMVEYIDAIEAQYYENCGFEREHGSFKKALDTFYDDMYHAKRRTDVRAGYEKCERAFESLPVDKGEFPLRVGIIGEYFTIMDAFSNLNLEQTIADMGVEVHRWMSISHRNLHYGGEKNLNVRINDLCRYEMGPTSTANIWCARDYAERGFDGIIHIKSAGCTPEIDIMPVLQRIGEQYRIPILFLTYDSQTSNTGVLTRLEAFYDMIDMRKRVLK